MIEAIEPQWEAPAGIRACCTTRVGGLSISPFDSFNLALHVGDDEKRVMQNRRHLRQALDLPAAPSWMRQTHGTDTIILEQDISRNADAAITREAGKVAVVMTADCLPILLCDQAGTEVAVVHAGWRGLQAGVIQSALAKMISSNDQLIAWIGPGISQACFEVGEEVRSAFIDSFLAAQDYFQAHRPGHWLCDLGGLAEEVLKQQGVNRVHRDPHCSFRDAELFYSYRRNAITGRMATLIWIK